MFVWLDASGANVFFTTTEQLVGQDVDTELDIYEVRVCTSGSRALTSPGRKRRGVKVMGVRVL